MESSKLNNVELSLSSNLDARFNTTKIVELKNNLGLTILLIEHDMDVIMRAEVDHVYVANQGEIITHGSPEEVKQNKEVIEAYLGK